MRNPELKKVIREITVYAYKGEKVKQALRRDGRLLNIVFKKNCVLSETSIEVTSEMSTLVDVLDGKTFQIKLLSKSSPPKSQPGSLDDADMIQNESQRSDSDGNQDPPQQSTSTESVKDNEPKEKPKPNGNISPGNMVCEIPHSETMQRHLSSQFKYLLKGMKTQPGLKLSRIHGPLLVEFGKSVETCREVSTMKKLMELSNSVCQVRINGRPEGSGFLLFDRFVLTNGHTVKNIYNESTEQLTERLTVHFSFESLDQTERGRESGAAVEAVVGFEHYLGVSYSYDWALLKLGADQTLSGLLKHFGFIPTRGGICIIGHPYGGVKRIDACFTFPSANCIQVVQRHFLQNQVEGTDYSCSPGPIQLVTDQFSPHVANSVEQKRQALTKSCFYFGSSGSPVFDEHCNVVAMHSGGYAYNNARGQSQSVIEFGHPLSVILERIVVQIVERKKSDVLKAFDMCLKEFFEYLSQRIEVPVTNTA
ncbi:serine protease FAM111A-like [Micropterus salmoides]|uniref:serine protease FAM111A-like n=1 Tax=Micropterus salmoides TaxID=27706 RepID=UPI0018ED47F6|nr:serine protease FAM111A-like [Micropterus salmoides]